MSEEKISLSKYSSFKIGGPARYFLEAKNVEEIVMAMNKWRRLLMPKILILGGGTNILFSDEGFNGLVIKIQNSKIKIQNDNSKFKIIKAEAGAPLSKLVEMTADIGLSGLEWAAGLPGTLGGAICGNAGAFGGEIKNVVKEIISLDISKSPPQLIKRGNKECDFDYRSSVFNNKKSEIVIEAILIFKKGEKKFIREIIEKNINYRQERHPLEYPSLGSTFKNFPAAQINQSGEVQPLKAAHLISEAGLKGVSCGGAMISPKHPNFIVNVLNASASDVKNLIELSKNKVYNQFKIKLEEEICVI